ncbi:MAG: hypothetical protein JWM93_862 [Frankiales bacterium]|nr:hypothetical protein [Frankiales bacterium]
MPSATDVRKNSRVSRLAGWLRRQWPWLTVAGLLCTGLTAMGFDHWRKGLFVIGASSLLGALYRAVLPARRVALLVVRSRSVDVAVMLSLGGTIMILSAVIPVIRRT